MVPHCRVVRRGAAHAAGLRRRLLLRHLRPSHRSATARRTPAGLPPHLRASAGTQARPGAHRSPAGRSAERSRLRRTRARGEARRVRARCGQCRRLRLERRSSRDARCTVSFKKPAPALQRAARQACSATARPIMSSRSNWARDPSERLTLDTPLLSSIEVERAKRRPVAIASLPPHVIDAVLAIEDRRYYYHPGVDPIRLTGAVFYTRSATAASRRRAPLPSSWCETCSCRSSRAGRCSRRGIGRSFASLLEMWVSLVMSRRATKDEILEMYLNAVPLGQRGSFAIIGVSEAARLFFGKDVSNLSIAEAATHRRRHPVAVGALAVQQPEPLPRPPQRRDPRDGRRRVHHIRAGRGCPEGTAHGGAARTRGRSAVLRRLRRSDAQRRVPGPDHDRHAAGRGLHHARSAPAAPRAGRCARGADATWTSCSRGASARAGPKRRSSRSIRARARFSRWSADVPTTSHSTTARSCRDGSRARCSSRSSISPHSNRRH